MSYKRPMTYLTDDQRAMIYNALYEHAQLTIEAAKNCGDINLADELLKTAKSRHNLGMAIENCSNILIEQ